MITTLLLAAAATAAGDCSADTKNLLARHDCGFASGVQGWKAGASGETVSHEPKDGSPKPGALKVAAGEPASAQATSPCVAVKPQTKYRYGARYRLAAGEVYICGLHLKPHSDAGCEEPTGDMIGMSDLVKTEWRAFDPKRRPEGSATADFFTTTAETRAVQLALMCSGPGAFTALFDDVFITEQ